MIPKEAIILAGGEGTRLRETLPGLAKVLAPVAGKPFLHYVLQYFSAAGIEKFIFALGAFHDQVENFLSKLQPTIDYSIVIEPEPLGTGGAIQHALNYCNENTVAVINGDSLFRVNLENISAFHHMCGAECTMALKPMKSFNRYGEVVLHHDYSIASFREKTEVKEGLINGGFYLLNKRLFSSHKMPVKYSFEEDYLGKLFAERRIFGVQQNGYFIDIGIPDDYLNAQADFKKVS